MDRKVSDSGAFQAKTDSRLDALEKQQQHDHGELTSMSEILNQYQVKVDILSDIVIKQHQEITELKNQMIDSQYEKQYHNSRYSGKTK